MTHSFDIEIAKQYGVNAAIILHDMLYWCEHSRVNKSNFHDGLYWTYNSNRALSEYYPYMSSKAIRTAIQKLIDAGLLVIGVFNDVPFDRTTWYAVTEIGRQLVQCNNDTVEENAVDDTDEDDADETHSKRANAFSQKGKCMFPKGQISFSQKGEPIPSQYSNNNIYNINARARAREEDINPFRDDDYTLPTGTVQQYALDNIKVMGYRAMEELTSYIEDLNEDIVRHAIDNALDNGVRTWGYVKSILNAYVDAGVKTVGEAKTLDEKHKQNKQQKQNTEPKPQPKTAEDMTQEELDYALNHGPFGKFY